MGVGGGSVVVPHRVACPGVLPHCKGRHFWKARLELMELVFVFCRLVVYLITPVGL